MTSCSIELNLGIFNSDEKIERLESSLNKRVTNYLSEIVLDEVNSFLRINNMCSTLLFFSFLNHL